MACGCTRWAGFRVSGSELGGQKRCIAEDAEKNNDLGRALHHKFDFRKFSGVTWAVIF